ncbi:MAG: family 78 glycoside hydrolase catalytic domain [Prevotella sp.]|nr:family 78 glycoside hydrolase catalytic domain [Prevotella sp.]
MRKYTLLYMMALLAPLQILARVQVGDLRVENMHQPLGLDTEIPRFSWKIQSDKQNVLQTSYQILVASSIDKIVKGDGDLWNSGEVKSDRQLWIPYAGVRLLSNQRAFWKVRITTNKGKSEWSEVQEFGIGLLSESKWRGQWIGIEGLQDGEQAGMHTRLSARYLRKEFKAKKLINRATAYVAGLGLYEFYINGHRVGGEQMLAPVPSDYRKTIYYNTFDITSLLSFPLVSNNEEGSFPNGWNAVGIVLGAGRYFPMRQEKAYKSPVFGFPKCRINIIVEYADGSQETWVTDSKWRLTTDGPIRSNNEYDGEEYDARKESTLFSVPVDSEYGNSLVSWTVPGFDDSAWLPAQRVSLPDGTLRGQMTPNVKIIRRLNPLSLKTGNDTNKYVIDFGQNTAGFVSVKVHGSAGDTIRLRYAEKLNADGTLYVANLRNAKSEDIYICNGRENGRPWHAIFSYHGFRYVEVTGMNNVKSDDFKALVVSDDMKKTGQFECSDTVLNKVFHNAWWGILSNYKGMPVDCPQRNERQPWLGDRTVGSLGESFLFDNERLYTKWMRDICDSQRSDGVICDVSPSFWTYYNDDVTWPAALPFTCDMLYSQFGNKQPIIDSYPSMKKWMSHVFEEYLHEGIITKDKYGDWCVPPEKLELIHSQDPARQTDGALISTAYGIRICQLMERFAALQNLTDDVQMWASKRAEMTKSFNKNFLIVKRGTSRRPGHVLYPDSVFYGNNTATANLLPLAFGIVPDDCKEEVVKNVVTNIIEVGKGHVTCGVIGVSWLLRGLSDNGFSDVAYLLATNKTYPSWGYMAENGATTIWELWNGDKADPAMNSGNHVMLLGDLLTWCYQYLAGIKNTGSAFSESKEGKYQSYWSQNGVEGIGLSDNRVAYKRFQLKPAFEIQDCEWVNASYETPYGTIASRWKKTLQHLDWTVEVPANTTADVYLPDGTVKTIGSGTYSFTSEIPVLNPAIMKDKFLYEHTFFPEAHASTIVETQKGDLVAAYFGGTKERNPDVCIWVSIKKKGSDNWSEPVLAADGVFELGSADAELAGITAETTLAEAGPVKKLSDESGTLTYDYITKKSNVSLPENLKRKACWNPVLFEMPDGELWLFFKIGATVGDWTGWLTKSRDGGKTWSTREPLPKGFLGPIKNKPELIGERLICGSSTEKDGWRFHVEIYDLKTKQWKYVGPVDAEKLAITDDMEPATTDIHHPIYQKGKEPKYIYSIQPSILKLKDGRLQVLMRTHNARLAMSFSNDCGDTWSKVTLSEVENNQSGTDAVTLSDGRHVLIYNNFETLPGTKKGPRTPISIAISEDGMHWYHALTLEDSPISQYSYPAIIQGKDGTLHCVYTWRRQRIAYKQIDLKKLK